MTIAPGPDGRVAVAHCDASGLIQGIALLAPADVAQHLAAVPFSVALMPEEAAKVVPGSRWLVASGIVSEDATDPPATDADRARAAAQIDSAAEAARQRFITPGDGQQLEYQATATEALAASAAADPLDPAAYPWLTAEQQALAAATGTTPTLRDIATQVLAQRTAWFSAGAQIKQIRREAKLKVAAAVTIGGIQTILTGLVWPTP